MSSDDELERIFEELDRRENGAAAVALAEEAVRLCDARGDVYGAWDARTELMDRVYYTGDWDKLLVHFGWCIAQHDRDPDGFPAVDLLWKYKWVIAEAVCMPQIAADRLLLLLTDMERRFLAAGATLRPVHQHRCYTMVYLGRPDEARDALAKWQATSRDWLSDCAACDPDSRVAMRLELGEEDAALDEAFALLRSRTSCAEVPHRTHARLLRPLLERGDVDLAMHHHHAGYAMVRKNTKLIGTQGEHIFFAGKAALDDDAVSMIERHLPHALSYPNEWERALFFVGMASALDAVRTRGRERAAIRLPESIEVGSDERGVAIEDLASWARGQARSLGERFDRRNGNAWLGDRLRAYSNL